MLGAPLVSTLLRSPKPYGEHSTDRGYNGIAFTNAANVWVNQVTVANADTAISLRWVDHATLLGEAAFASVLVHASAKFLTCVSEQPALDGARRAAA